MSHWSAWPPGTCLTLARAMLSVYPALLLLLFGSPPPLRPEAPLDRSERAALRFVRAHLPRQRVCAAPSRRPVAWLNFQEELTRLVPRYTRAFLDSVDTHADRAGAMAPASVGPAGCAQVVEFPRTRLPGFLVCEVFPAGDRTFTTSRTYLFRVDQHRVRLIGHHDVAYN